MTRDYVSKLWIICLLAVTVGMVDADEQAVERLIARMENELTSPAIVDEKRKALEKELEAQMDKLLAEDLPGVKSFLLHCRPNTMREPATYEPHNYDRPHICMLARKYLTKVPEAERRDLYKAIIEAPAYNKRMSFPYLFFHGFEESNEIEQSLMRFCMEYLDAPQVSREAAWALFTYLNAAALENFIGNDGNADFCKWVEKQAQRPDVNAFYANLIMADYFPWDERLANRIKAAFQAVVDNGPDVRQLGVLSGFYFRVGYNFIKMRAPDAPVSPQSIPPRDAPERLVKELGKIMAAKPEAFLAIVTPQFEDNPAQDKYLGPLLLYRLGTLVHDAPEGKKILETHYARSPLGAAVLDGLPLGESIYAPEELEHYAALVFKRLAERKYGFQTEMSTLRRFSRWYFKDKRIPEAAKTANRQIVLKVLGIEPE